MALTAIGSLPHLLSLQANRLGKRDADLRQNARMSENDSPELPRDLMKPGAVAELLQVHLATVYRAMERGTLPFWRGPGRQRRVSRRDALAMVRLSRMAEEPRHQPMREDSAAEKQRQARRDLETLRAAGLDKYL